MSLLENSSSFISVLGVLISILIFLGFLFLFMRLKIVQKTMSGVSLLSQGFFGGSIIFLFFYVFIFIYHAKNIEESTKLGKTGWLDNVGLKQFIILHIPTLIIWFVAWFYILKYLITKFLF